MELTRRRVWGLAWLVIALTATALIVLPLSVRAEGDDRDDQEKVTFALWGDMPYAKAGDSPKMPALIQDINRAKPAFTIFDSDVKDGSSVCSNDVIGAQAIARFNSLEAPTVYVPGDNDWTDCHRINNGSFDNLERLDYIRKTMFSTKPSFGQRKMDLEHQGALSGPYSENTRWFRAGVVFVGLNIPGSNNNLVPAGTCIDPKSARTQVQCDADNAEYAQRDAKNIQWLRDSFAMARQRRAAGLMVVIQADPGFDWPETETVNERTLPGFEGYNNFLAALMSETQAFSGQVVLVHGDTHFFKLDKPLIDQSHLIENFSRLETFGSPNIHWVEVTVDPRSREVFTFRPRIVPGN